MTNTLTGYTYIYKAGTGPRTFILLHGTGGNEHDILTLGEALDVDAHILSVRGNVSEHGMNRYFKRLAEGVFDREDLTKRTEELTAFIHAASKKHMIDLSNTVGVGFSNGANILLHLICMHPHLLKAAILLRPMSAALPDAVENPGMPVYIGAGAHDELIPQSDAEHIASSLKTAGTDVTFNVMPVGHRIGADDVHLVQTWLAALR